MIAYFLRAVFVAVVVSLSVGCATKSYRPQPDAAAALQARAQSQSKGSVTVSASVPGAVESEQLFGLPLYMRGVQPVWLDIENRGDDLLRFTPTSVDDEYFSPLEVAYVHRRGYTKDAKQEMEQYFYEQGMERFIPPGESRAGYVFTHLRAGTKAFNVDVFGHAGTSYRFTFFLDVPGFTPDYAEIDFRKLYAPGQVRVLDEAGLREALKSLPCCSADSSGALTGNPFNVVFIAQGRSLRYALLRADWVETERREGSHSQSHHYLGRPPDGTFHKLRRGGGTRDELRVWLMPMMLGETPVWLAQVSHDLAGSKRGLILDAEQDTTDPDLDAARRYLLQNFWYAQALAKYGHVWSGEAVPIGEPRANFDGAEYFTDGYLAVLWIADEPTSLLDVVEAGWGRPPSPSELHANE
jgi:hypothetical protein